MTAPTALRTPTVPPPPPLHALDLVGGAARGRATAVGMAVVAGVRLACILSQLHRPVFQRDVTRGRPHDDRTARDTPGPRR